VFSSKEISSKKFLPVALSRLMKEEILDKLPPKEALAHALASESMLLSFIDGGKAPLPTEWRKSLLDMVEVTRATKRTLADRLDLTLSQREALGI